MISIDVQDEEQLNMTEDFRWKWVVIPGLSLFSIFLVMFLAGFPPNNILKKIETVTYDWRMRMAMQQQAANRKGGSIEDVVIIEIDEKSIANLGAIEQWPHHYFARLIHKIQDDKPAAIGFNLYFGESDTKNRKSDDSLRMAIEKAGNIFLPLSFSKANPDAFFFPMKNPPAGFKSEKFSYQISAEDSISSVPEPDRFDGKFLDLYNQATGVGFINFLPRTESTAPVIREVPLFIKFADRYYPSLSLAILLATAGITPENLRIGADGKIKIRNIQPDSQVIETTIPTDKNGYLLVNYQGPLRSFRTIPFIDVFQGRIPKAFFRGKIVLVGSSANKNYDWFSVPFHAQMTAVEIRANILHSVLNHSYIRRVGVWGTFLIKFFWVILLAFIVMRSKIWHGLIFILIAFLIYTVFAILLFVYLNIFIELVTPLLTFLMVCMSIFLYRYSLLYLERQAIKKRFVNRLSSEQLKELVKNGAELESDGKKTTATILFSDINNFAALAENQHPEDLLKILNEYHAVMTDVILKWDGFLDKYQGDKIMAIFGAPLSLENHAKRACLAALEMQYRLAQLRVKWELENKPQMEARIGIHQGVIVVGNIGGVNRFDYTAIGETVNLASRLEAANKIYGTAIMLSEDVYELVKEILTVRELDYLPIKGRRKPLVIYELIAKKDDRLDENMQQLLEHYQKGLSIYRQGNWESAFNEFRSALKHNSKDGPSREFFHRCIVFIEQKRFVPANWDGVFESKPV